MVKYSQNNEQEIIVDYFRTTPPGQKYFLDIGANDGKTLSNTYALFLMGWKGTLIEASQEAFNRLIENYLNSGMTIQGIDMARFALGNKPGVRMLNESGALLGKEDVALVSTFHEHEMARFRKCVEYVPIPVNCITWEQFMGISDHKKFDFISMDIEGCELEVLPDMDLDALETKMICIEWNSKPELKTEYEKYLREFKLIHSNQENLIYVR